MPSSLVIGYGSIGKRHAEVLSQMGHEVTIVTSQTLSDNDYPSFNSIEEAFSNKKLDYVVIAKPTHQHYECLTEVRRRNSEISILCEKPLFADLEEIGTQSTDLNPDHTFVGYQLRFSPLITALEEEIKGEKILSFNSYVGQNLESWRERDYKESYSSSKEKGGGVLRDLSHELDYMVFLFGAPEKLTSISKKISSLEIDSDDHCTTLFHFPSGLVGTVEMNYLDRNHRRTLSVNTDKKTIFVDFIKGTFVVNQETKEFPSERNNLFEKMHDDVLHNKGRCCTFNQGKETLQIIERIERAENENRWC